eukprot:CAMPEP_0175964786 /NCGR_PEP_ID=MMETSP0108-20121206/37741_1 /TAXON_ID=195067 ORGANISM="Goniomonas pacifica, Strain CCMP1869" /NCGR_SAMPLE_ID=MMETSP0108 /ASSEMBLY_ACC=CAM_ASM_000204 /LENGTH=46 /DNA_ID= /DNA_START= /DNA_END= /DNA_ORIENTATION=
MSRLLAALFEARLRSAQQPSSCTTATLTCASIPLTTAPIPPARAMA